jgi:hypothetical protein
MRKACYTRKNARGKSRPRLAVPRNRLARLGPRTSLDATNTLHWILDDRLPAG